MGANNSTRRVSFESDENENITVVKGIRLSENVIKRMRDPETPPKPQPAPTPPPPPPPVAPILPPSHLRPVPPLFDPITSMPPLPLPVLEPVAPPPPPPPQAPAATESVVAPPLPSPPPQLPAATETVVAPPPPATEQVASPPIIDLVLPASSPPVAADVVAAPAFEPVAAPPAAPADAVETVILPAALPPAPSAVALGEEMAAFTPASDVTQPSPPAITQSIASSPPVIEPLAPPHVIEPVTVAEPKLLPPVNIEPIASLPLPESESLSSPPLFEPVTSLAPQSAEPIAAPPLPEFTAPCEPVAPPPQPTVEPVSPEPVAEPVAEAELSPVEPPAAAPVDQEALRKKITDELHFSLDEERVKAEQDLQAWLDAEKARVSAQAQAEAQSQVQDEVSRILSVERGVTQENLQQAILRERIATEDEKLRAQLFQIGQRAKQLEAREADLKRQDAFYREQVARLEERSAEFYKVTTENYHRAADEVNAKFKRYEMYPVCADLQGQILACYKENAGKTLNCSNIAALYLQCVNNAKQNKMRTGG